MENYDDAQILNGILENDTKIISCIYQRYYASVLSYVNSNGGSADDANDIFQDAIIVIYRKLKANDLIISCAFETYLYSVSKFLWLKQMIKKEKNLTRNFVKEINFELFDFEQDYYVNERNKVFQKIFKKLSNDERQLLELYSDKTNKEKISALMGFSNFKELNIAFSRAKKHFKKLIENDPEYKKIRSALDNYIDKQDIEI